MPEGDSYSIAQLTEKDIRECRICLANDKETDD